MQDPLTHVRARPGDIAHFAVDGYEERRGFGQEAGGAGGRVQAEGLSDEGGGVGEGGGEDVFGFARAGEQVEGGEGGVGAEDGVMFGAEFAEHGGVPGGAGGFGEFVAEPLDHGGGCVLTWIGGEGVLVCGS